MSEKIEMFELSKLLYKIEHDYKRVSKAYCEECTWVGDYSSCETYQDSDGSEFSTIYYTVAICPKCDKDSVVIYSHSKHLYCDNCYRRKPTNSRCKFGHKKYFHKS